MSSSESVTPDAMTTDCHQSPYEKPDTDNRRTREQAVEPAESETEGIHERRVIFTAYTESENDGHCFEERLPDLQQRAQDP